MCEIHDVYPKCTEELGTMFHCGKIMFWTEAKETIEKIISTEIL